MSNPRPQTNRTKKAAIAVFAIAAMVGGVCAGSVFFGVGQGAQVDVRARRRQSTSKNFARSA